MSGWKVELSNPAQREFRQLDDGPRQAATELILDLMEEGPLLPAAIELEANPDLWSVRFHHDRFRMVYEGSRSRKRIRVTRIRPRNSAYDGLKH